MLVESVSRMAAVVVPAQDRQPPPGQLPEWGNSSPVGLMVVLLLLLATVFLIRSMSKRLKRLPESFDEQDGSGAAPSEGEPPDGTRASDVAPADDRAGPRSG